MSNVKKEKIIYTVEDEKRAKKRFVIIVAVCLACVIAAGFILGFIYRPGLNFLADYESVRIVSNSDTKSIVRTEVETDATRDQYHLNTVFNSGLKKTRYSVLRMLLELNFSQNFKYETKEEEYTDDDGETQTRDVRVELTGTAITSYENAEGEFTLIFDFAREQDGTLKHFVKVEGEKIYYDRVIVTVSNDGNNSIESFNVRFLDSQMLFGNSEEVYDYYVTPVIIKAKTQKFMLALKDVLDYFK